MGGDAADARVDLVEDECLAAGNRSERQRNPRELAARGRLRNGSEGQSGVRSDDERGLVAPRRAGLPLARIALAWVVRHEDFTLAIAGSTSVENARSNAEAGSVELEPWVLEELAALRVER